jgi:hypothetical protein
MQFQNRRELFAVDAGGLIRMALLSSAQTKECEQISAAFGLWNCPRRTFNASACATD